MMKKGQIIFATALLVCANAIAVFAQNKPFPQQLTYPGCIKPSVSQATLNSDVLAYYNYWKGQYLKKSTANASHYYIAAGSTGGSNQAVTQSEAHGYGMVITALMAGADANAKTYYDGLYGMYDTHRSANNNNLMQWQVFADEHNANIGSATDGDMDIAYSLLLAHYQWGSNGTINYLAAAQKMITNGLKASYVYNTLRLGLADDATSDHLSTRPSDWMFDHMRAFKANTNDVIWDQLAANLYNVYQTIYTNYSPNTGLISDFVMYDPAQPAPPGQPQADEGNTTGDYSYNACRVPLRLVMDFAHYGTTSPKPYLSKMVSWARNKTGENPTKFGAGYKLNGTAISGTNYESGCFISPMIAASVIDVNNQKWLNDGWAYMKGSKDSYYEDTYNALCMLFVSGNWWIPSGSAPTNIAPTVSITSPSNNASFTAPAGITINANAADVDGTVSKVDFYNGTTLLNSDATAPYSFAWTNVPAGTYSITAKATDNSNATTSSTVVTVVVTTVTLPNQPPTVSITSPANNSSYTASASITINANAADPDGTVSKVDFYNGTTLLGSDNSAPYSFAWTNVGAGTYTITAKATDNANANTTSSAVSVTVNPIVVTQSPYGGTPQSIPGVIEAEKYDLGGQGIAYNETTTANQGGAFRTTEAVDVEAYDTGYDVGYIVTGEWMEYTVNVTAGTYKIDANVAAITAGKTFRLELDGTTIATFTVPNTGDWGTFQLSTVTNVALTAGQKILRLYAIDSDFNVDKITFTAVNSNPNVAPTVSLTSPANGASFNAPASISIAASAADADGTVSKVDFYNGATLLGSDNSAPYSFAWTNVATGTYSITAKATDNLGATTTSAAVSVSVTPVVVTQTPYGGTPQFIPGVIEAEKFDLGGQGIAYNETTTANQGGAFRTTEAVDIEAYGAGYDVGYIVADEWLEYTVNVTAGTYKIDANVAAIAVGKNFRLELDGATIATFTVPNTGDWATFQLSTVTNVALTAGQKVLRLYATSSDFNVDKITFTAVNSNSNVAPSVSLTSPANDASVNAPATIAIAATAADVDGTVSKVDFYNGTTLLYSDNSSPYSYNWTNVATGTYSITAKATDNSGATTNSSVANVTVNTVATNACSSIAQYTENNGYVAGSKVKNTNSQYQCKPYPYSGWCNGASWAYAPGSGAYWTDAWTLVGSCGTARTSADASVNEKTISNTPNPFSSVTSIEVVTAEAGEASIKVYDQTGQLVQTLSEGYLMAGTHQFTFDASTMKPGLYIVKCSTNSGVTSRKIMKAE